MAYRIGQAVLPPRDPVIAHSLEAASQRHGVPEPLLRSVAWHESRYKLSAVSPKGAQGLMQLMPATARGLGVDAFNPAQAADGAARLLKRYHRKYGGWAAPLAAYNWGPGNVDRQPAYDASHWPKSVQRYVHRVLESAGLPVPFAYRLLAREGGRGRAVVVAVK